MNSVSYFILISRNIERHKEMKEYANTELNWFRRHIDIWKYEKVTSCLGHAFRGFICYAYYRHNTPVCNNQRLDRITTFHLGGIRAHHHNHHQIIIIHHHHHHHHRHHHHHHHHVPCQYVISGWNAKRRPFCLSFSVLTHEYSLIEYSGLFVLFYYNFELVTTDLMSLYVNFRYVVYLYIFAQSDIALTFDRCRRSSVLHARCFIIFIFF